MRQSNPSDYVTQRADGLVKVRLSQSNYEPLDEFIAGLHRDAEGLVDVIVDAEMYYDSVTIFLEGWRPPTPEEVEQLAKQKTITDKQARDQLRRLRRDHPELFDKQGRPVDPMPDPEEVPF